MIIAIVLTIIFAGFGLLAWCACRASDSVDDDDEIGNGCQVYDYGEDE